MELKEKVIHYNETRPKYRKNTLWVSVRSRTVDYPLTTQSLVHLFTYFFHLSFVFNPPVFTDPYLCHRTFGGPPPQS